MKKQDKPTKLPKTVTPPNWERELAEWLAIAKGGR